MWLQRLIDNLRARHERARQRAQRLELSQLGAQLSAHMRADLGLDNPLEKPPAPLRWEVPQMKTEQCPEDARLQDSQKLR